MNTLPELALGAWLMGGAKDPNPNNDDQSDILAIRLALDNGISLIDTAQNYADGKCEEIVGRAVEGLPRDSFQILTKQNKEHLSYQEVIDGCQASIQRLGLDYIDYFLCHAPNPDFDIADFFRATNQLHKDGLIREVGVSNFGPKSLRVALDTSDVPIKLNQVSFSLNDGSIFSSGTYDFCQANNIPIQAYRTLANITDDHEIVKVLEEMTDIYSLTPQQIALAYLNSYENIHFTIRASSKKHWDEIKEALKVKLANEDIAKLRALQNDKQSDSAKFLKI